MRIQAVSAWLITGTTTFAAAASAGAGENAADVAPTSSAAVRTFLPIAVAASFDDDAVASASATTSAGSSAGVAEGATR